MQKAKTKAKKSEGRKPKTKKYVWDVCYPCNKHVFEYSPGSCN